MADALRLAGVSAGYGKVQVLRDLDLVVPAGAAVALLGANGAGKTTTLRVVAGSIPAASGHIEVGGVDVTGTSVRQRVRRGLCLIPEGRGIFPQLTVRDNVAMFVHGRRVDDAIETATSYFPMLGERLRQQAGTMSGGQQQMLALARALLTDATLVMADELSVGLAPVALDVIFGAVESMRTAGCSLLVVEQYADRILDIADYVYILHKGSVAFVGEPAQCRDGSVFEEYLQSSVAT